MSCNRKHSIPNENIGTDNKNSAIEELENEKLKKVDKRKKTSAKSLDYVLATF